MFTQGTGQKYQPSARRQGENNICFPVSILVVCERTQEGVLVHSGDKCYIHARIHTRIHTHSHIHIRTIHASTQLSFCFFYNLPVHPSCAPFLGIGAFLLTTLCLLLSLSFSFLLWLFFRLMIGMEKKNEGGLDGDDGLFLGIQQIFCRSKQRHVDGLAC